MKRAVIVAFMLGNVLALGVSQTGGSWTVTNTGTWIGAVNGIRSGGNNKAYTITVTGAVSVPPSTESTFGASTGISVTLEGSGTLSLSANGSLLDIGENQTIIAKNLTLQGRDANTGYSAISVKNGGVFRMEGSALVTGNTDNRDGNVGGGVHIKGTFTMKDNASVSGNTAIGSYNRNGFGGGVGVGKDGTFIMQGGTISGNTAKNYKDFMYSYGDGYGGGVMVGISGTFTMQGGAISGNTASSYGGAVSISGGTFTMQGGTISGNTAQKDGGGVLIGETGTFTKTGGTIYGNDTEQDLRNTGGSKKGHVVYNRKSGAWRNSTADSAMNTNSYGFWLSETE